MAFELMDSYHLSPTEIDQMPYNRIQEIFLLRRIKSESHNLQVEKEKFRREHTSSGRGGTRRRTREV